MVHNQVPDPQDQVLDFKFSLREATLILNKLNTVPFVGFNEASTAMQIFAKIQATVKNAQSVNPDTRMSTGSQPPQTLKTAAAPAAPLRAVDNSQQSAISENSEAKPKAFQTPPEPEPVRETPPMEQESGVFSVIDKTGDI